jgi:hypothetical protein
MSNHPRVILTANKTGGFVIWVQRFPLDMESLRKVQGLDLSILEDCPLSTQSAALSRYIQASIYSGVGQDGSSSVSISPLI